MYELKMPSLGADMDSGKIVSWHAKPGDQVKKGQIVATVETLKAAFEVESWRDGTVEQIVVEEGRNVPVGTVLALLRVEGEEPQEISPRKTQVEEKSPAAGKIRVSPAAKKLAHNSGIELSTVHGSGPQGTITLEDVEKVVGKSHAVSEAAPQDREQAMREAISRLVSRSKREIPHYYLSTEVEMEPALRWLEAENAKRSVDQRMLYAVLLIKAVGLACKEFPDFNGFWIDGRFRQAPSVRVGIITSLRRGGILVPSIEQADSKSLDDLMKELRDLVTRARQGLLHGNDVAEPSITITNLGEQGVGTVFGVIYPPQVALVGFGKLETKPWVVDSQVVPRRILTVTLAADHRASDGHRGGLFLAAIARLLSDPAQLNRGSQ